MEQNNQTKTSKELIKESGESRKKAGKGALMAIGNTAKGLRKALDAGDKAIGEKIDSKKLEQGNPKISKLQNAFRYNILKVLLGMGVLTYGGVKIHQTTVHKDENKIELNQDTDLVFDESTLYRSDSIFFQKDFELKIDNQYEKYGIHLLRDAGMTFYIVQKGDTKIGIRDKLTQIDEFSYLKNKEYNDKISGFNIPAKSLDAGMYIPIPIEIEKREIDLETFSNFSKKALQEMKNDHNYGEKIQKLCAHFSEDEIVEVMSAFARSETAKDYAQFSDNIGSTALHRWEPKYKSYSFSYYHILMEKNADNKTYGPGLSARTKLGLTEGQCYHPENAGKLFLGYCCEKVKDPAFFFKINSLDDAKKVGKVYNGSADYGEKLRANLQYIKGIKRDK